MLSSVERCTQNRHLSCQIAVLASPLSHLQPGNACNSRSAALCSLLDRCATLQAIGDYLPNSNVNLAGARLLHACHMNGSAQTRCYRKLYLTFFGTHLQLHGCSAFTNNLWVI